MTIANARALIPVLDHDPDDALTLLALASMAQVNGKRELALSYYQTAQRVPAAEEETLINLLELEYEVGHWAEALAAADRLKKLNPWRLRS
ncbi:MAG: hypothetical protein H0T47_09755 [Planctomycetaceae bacterium]|nr:hypothetical protein [Planctomycetaceae bacterium]